MKREIEFLLQENRIQEAWKQLLEYEKQFPDDVEINNYKYVVAALLKDYQAAWAFAGEAVRMMPYDADCHFNFAVACETMGETEQALEHYYIALGMAKFGQEVSFDICGVESIIQNLKEKQVGKISGIFSEFIGFKENVGWEIDFPTFHSSFPLIGQRYFDYKELPPMFIGLARSDINSFQETRRSTYEVRAEMQRITMTNKEIHIKCEESVYVPILIFEPMILRVNDGVRVSEIQLKNVLQYANLYFPKGEYDLASDVYFVVGKVCPIGHKSERKKLVLSIFVDGLSQYFLENQGEDLMPNTTRFFKKGVKCKNVHTTGDWTLPSIVSATTGKMFANHQVIHSKNLRRIDFSTPILFEYFEEKGYNTSKYGGNWRITPTYGYARGMNRVIYQHQYNGYPIEDVISDVQNQMYEMRETDQFIWMEVLDLHQVADELNILGCVSQIPAMENTKSYEGQNVNSVKQVFDPLKIKYYEEKIRYVDRKLEALYHYIEENYSDDDIIVSLFSDHGQGYLLKPEDEFLCEKRTKTALFIRGNGVMGDCEEMISLCDYSEIMCKMANIPYGTEFTDSNLPQYFGGEREREYVITESIHVGDPYRISLKGKNFSFYLNGKQSVTEKCRVPLDEYSVKLHDENGVEVDDTELKELCTQISLKHIAPVRKF